MLAEIFINSCILITFMSIAQHFLKDKDINQNPSIFLKILIGLCAGLLGILLMLFSVQVNPEIITDYRAIPILLTALYGGLFPTIMAALIMGAFRILYFGVSYAAILAVIIILLMGIGFSVINLITASRKKKWIYSITFLLIVNTIPMMILIKNLSFLFKSFAIYCVSMGVMVYLIFMYTEYLSESTALYKRLKNEAAVDFLTGLNNVRQFDNLFNVVSQQAIRNRKYLSLLFLDIDCFKKINDTYGHSCGDIIIRSVADILCNTCRNYGIVSRNGGEEFSVLLLDCPSSRAFEIAERIRKNIEANKFQTSDKVGIGITISIGISTYPNITDNMDKLLEHADNALYEAKRNGRNKVALYDNVERLKKVEYGW